MQLLAKIRHKFPGSKKAAKLIKGSRGGRDKLLFSIISSHDHYSPAPVRDRKLLDDILLVFRGLRDCLLKFLQGYLL